MFLSFVIKELIDNALDAGATKISVDVSGKHLTVSDNGRGFTELSSSNKSSGHNIGFRGQALYSISFVTPVHIYSHVSGVLTKGIYEVKNSNDETTHIKLKTDKFIIDEYQTRSMYLGFYLMEKVEFFLPASRPQITPEKLTWSKKDYTLHSASSIHCKYHLIISDNPFESCVIWKSYSLLPPKIYDFLARLTQDDFSLVIITSYNFPQEDLDSQKYLTDEAIAPISREIELTLHSILDHVESDRCREVKYDGLLKGVGRA